MSRDANQLLLFDARVLGPLVEYLDRHGAPTDRYLDHERVPREAIAAGGWIAKKQAYDLVHAVVAGERCREAVLAAYDGFRLDDLGPIAKAVSSCRTVKEALEVTTRLGGSAFEGNNYLLQIDGDTTWLSYRDSRQVSEGQDWINDMTLGAYRQIIGYLVSADWRPEQILTRSDDLERHLAIEDLRDCRLTAGAGTTAIAFPTEFLSRRLKLHEESYDPRRCEEWIPGTDNEDEFVDAVHRLVATRFNYSRLPSLRELARLSDVSTATLKRRFSLAGISYRELLDRIRFDKAEELLSEGSLAIKEIAQELGYSGTNNFARAFHRMTAITPAEFRRRCGL